MTGLQGLFRNPRVSRIKNVPRRVIPRDFRFSTFSFLLLAVVCAGAFGAMHLSGFALSGEEFQGVVYAVILGALLLVALPTWGMLVIALMASWAVLYSVSGSDRAILYAVPALSLLPAAMVNLLLHWDRAVILRLGRFHRVRGAGLFLLPPFIDRIAARVDTRIRVTDFSAERTLSRDNVPVHVDAICFWMIWDAQKAVLEVQDFLEAVTLSAQTALREAIGSHNLEELLSERDQVGAKLQKILDAKTNPWGITVLSVEFTDIVIPGELEDAMSRHAQADREHRARIILGDTEIQLAEKMRRADEYYRDNPQAFQLRAMNMVYDALRQSKGSVVLVPSSAAEQMNLGHPVGLVALQNKLAAMQNREDDQRGPTGDSPAGGEENAR
ncbi:MAG: slipin family protein [Spirochaetaceae bacterium]|nr:MAG: slipin family protein [Spirochaetaceae bacterium]